MSLLDGGSLAMASRVNARPSSLVSAAACVCVCEREKMMMPACVAERMIHLSSDDLYLFHAAVVGNGRRENGTHIATIMTISGRLKICLFPIHKFPQDQNVHVCIHIP